LSALSSPQQWRRAAGGSIGLRTPLTTPPSTARTATTATNTTTLRATPRDGASPLSPTHHTPWRTAKPVAAADPAAAYSSLGDFHLALARNHPEPSPAAAAALAAGAGAAAGGPASPGNGHVDGTAAAAASPSAAVAAAVAAAADTASPAASTPALRHLALARGYFADAERAAAAAHGGGHPAALAFGLKLSEIGALEALHQVRR